MKNNKRPTQRATLPLAALALRIIAFLPFSALGDVVLPMTATWRYNTNDLSAVNWMSPAYDDTTWASGAALLYIESAALPAPKNTPLPPRVGGISPVPTYYFRTTFTVTNTAALTAVSFSSLIDDGGVFYLNGSEIQRLRMAAGPVSYTQLTTAQAIGANGDATVFESFILSGESLTNVVEGVNHFAFEVHQNSVNSSDVAFGCEVSATYGQPQANLLREPYLQLSSSTNITICWRTDIAVGSRVVYGTNPVSLTFTNESSTPQINHFVTLTGLQPDTRYYYAVGSDGTNQPLAGPGADYFFLTHPEPGTEKSLRVWVIGDAGTSTYGEEDAINQRAVRDSFLSYNGTNTLHAWLQLGDNAYRDGTDEEHQVAMFNVYSNLLRSSVTWPTLGNHDTAGKTDHVDTYPYFSIFHLPKAGEAGGVPSGTEHYYSFDLGMVHFVCLDSMTADRSTNGAMANWLRADLAANRSRWTVVFWHYPPYSKGGYDSDERGDLIAMRENFGPIIEAGGADLMLSGHSHVYERSHLINGHYGSSATFNPATMVVQPGSGRETNGIGAYLKPDGLGEPPVGNRGTVYIVMGCSGEATSVGSLNHPAMYYSQSVLGSVVLDFASNRLDVAYLHSSGVVADWFTIIKEGTYPPAISDSSVTPSGPFQMTVHSRAYRTNIVESAESLAEPVNWMPVKTNVSQTPAFLYSETNQATAPERYYRVIRP
ncbi:MAG TPA: metallophosphoesterase family protein [Verrucomicrobiota bacterium]|nr:metallophosphoesterase family protein [Verrucomicrobiota bacterium]